MGVSVVHSLMRKKESDNPNQATHLASKHSIEHTLHVTGLPPRHARPMPSEDQPFVRSVPQYGPAAPPVPPSLPQKKNRERYLVFTFAVNFFSCVFHFRPI